MKLSSHYSEVFSYVVQNSANIRDNINTKFNQIEESLIKRNHKYESEVQTILSEVTYAVTKEAELRDMFGKCHLTSRDANEEPKRVW
mmetsp:Transcript_4407/g.9870  ORF Transcript_4407/g.9870 Transcript_4407/m.9870 type:complete len:87 (+) Transcript_4407:434-694(+)